jgi:TolB-like protein
MVARGTAFSFKGKHVDPRLVGEQLNVRTVLEGSIRRSDNRLRVTVRLVNASAGGEKNQTEGRGFVDLPRAGNLR